MDKVVLEPFAAKVPTILSFDSFEDVCGEYMPDLKYTLGNYDELAEKIITLTTRKDLDKVLDTLADRVEEGYSIKALIPKIIDTYETS